MASHYFVIVFVVWVVFGIGFFFGETLLVQLVAVVANRLILVGLGGLVFIVWYFIWCGFDLLGVFGVVSALLVLGAFVDLLVFCVFVMGF